MIRHPYAFPEYTHSLSHIGQEYHVQQWNTSILIRSIDGVHQDATGSYPLQALPHDCDVQGGLDYLSSLGLASIIITVDDYHRPSLDVLQSAFDFVHPFKTHYVQKNVIYPPLYDSHHRYEVGKSLKHCRIEKMDLANHLHQWTMLYDELCVRHRLSGIHKFPRKHHEHLAKAEGFLSIGAWIEDELVSCHIWACADRRAHSHLAASNAKGYKTSAAYGVNDYALKCFENYDVVNFGGGAGIADVEDDGLAKFKRGFANSQSSSYLCGAILNETLYNQLLINRNIKEEDTNFFPAYRANLK